jgi:serine protease inhibitor
MFAFLLGLLMLQDQVRRTAAVSSVNLMEAQHSFADTLTANLYANENDFTSALGVSMAFGLIYPSSIAASREEMESVFGYDQYFEEGETPTNEVLLVRNCKKLGNSLLWCRL